MKDTSRNIWRSKGRLNFPINSLALYLPLWETSPCSLLNGTGIATGAPKVLGIPATNTITVTQAGTFLIYLPTGATGTATSGTMTVTNSPVSLVGGLNTITTTGATGNFTVVIPTRIEKSLNALVCTVTGGTWGNQGVTSDGDDYITVAVSSALNITNNLTVESWFKTPATFETNATAFTGLRTIISKWQAAGNKRSWYCALVNVENGGSIDNFAVGLGDPADGTNEYLGYCSTDLVVSTWYHVVMTFASGALVVYINTVPVTMTAGVGAVPASLYNNTTTSVLCGGINAGATNPWKSIQGEHRVYSGVLSAVGGSRNYRSTKWRYS